ncbi:glycosyltransferase 87 family protein [Pseudonocardia nigra]|uniref:glycosyltransferase 87 family protein n=1 Tax=Pseudonocardia nigra TaxID=1921578 RepID=UPI001C5F7320|nr:glycosyltransferase 87 family protein [Pseudonocardia nigra]
MTGTDVARPAVGRRAVLSVGMPVAAAIVLAQVVVVALWPDAHLLLIDLEVYRAGGERVLGGAPLYAAGVVADLPFVYPPFAAVLFAPLALLPLGLLKALWTAAGIGLLGYVVHRCLRALGVAPSIVLTSVLTVAATALDPVRTTLYLGQINIVPLALVVGDVLGRRESRWRGVGVGLAAAIKLTPLVFVAYLVVTRRLRAAAVAVATFAAAAALGFLVAPADSATFWLDGTFAAADRISDVAGSSNHSLNGLLARLIGETKAGWLVGAGVLGLVTIALAVRAHRVGQELLAVTLCGLASAALAPFAWSHHWVWFVPLLVLLGHGAAAGARGAGLLGAGVLAGTVAVITALPGPGVGPLPQTGLISLYPDVYLLLFVAVLVGSGRWLRRRVP